MNNITSAILIDSNELDNFINKKILEKHGITTITTFKSAIHALFYLQGTALKYKLILTGIYMPGMDGFEFIDEFRKLNLHKKHGKIYLLSTSVDPLDKEKADKRGVQLIDKPLTIKKINELN